MADGPDVIIHGLAGLTGSFPPARDIWISSGLRGGASQLRESPGFGRLDLFGIPWILSSEMSLFNGLQATPGPFLFFGGPFPQGPIVFDPKVERTKAPRPAEEAGQAGDHGNRHRGGPIGHWDQTNAAFAFLQGIVDLAPFYAKLRRPTGSLESVHRASYRASAHLPTAPIFLDRSYPYGYKVRVHGPKNAGV